MSIRHVVKTVAASGAAVICAAAFTVSIGVGTAGANTITNPDGVTLTPPAGSANNQPYSSGQTIDVSAGPNTPLSNSNLVNAKVPGQTTNNPTGNYVIEECTDPGGTTANLPTGPNNCEGLTSDPTTPKSQDGSFDDPTYTVYSLPDGNLVGSPNMTGSCGEAPNYCVIGIFAVSPQSGGFNFPNTFMFSSPFVISAGDGTDDGLNPGDGTPEAPLAIGLPIVALGAVGGLTIRNRRRSRQQQQAA